MKILLTFKSKILKGAISPMTTEWWTEKDWEKHRKRVEELKASGEYLKEEEFSMTLVYHPLFDGDLEAYKRNHNCTIKYIE